MRPALALLLSGLLAVAAAPPKRILLQADADIIAEDQYAPVFQLVSSTSNPIFPQSLISSFVSTLEMDTLATFAQTWTNGRYNNWLDGNTRWNLTVTFTQNVTGTQPYTAALHTVACPADVAQVGLGADTLYIPPGNTSADMRGSFEVSGGQGNFSVPFSFLIDYDSVESVVIYPGLAQTGTNVAACANMIPPPPDFPTDWSAMIETNIVNRGLTFTTRQLYSQTLNTARLDLTSYSSDRIILTNFTAGNITFISPANATYPNGVCNTSTLPPFLNDLTDETNVSLIDTSQFLRFDYDKAVYSPGHESVRGILCEKWVIADTYTRRNSSGSYNASYFFPVDQWQVGRQDYHRLLKQVLVEGVDDDGDEFQIYSGYVNFKPQNYTNDTAAFDVCAIAPQGAGCGCTKERIAALNGLTLNSDPDSVLIGGSNQDEDGVCKLSSGNPHGFIRSQAGPYIGLVIIGAVAGTLFTLLGTWLFSRRRGAGHTRFTDGPA